MPSALHLINRDGERGRPLNLDKVADDVWRTCCWAISAEDAAALVGGWVYLHSTKGEPSFFGGIVTAAEPVVTPEHAREDRFAFIFDAKPKGRGQRWRGKAHSMAWTGGLVEADAAHEVGD